MHTWPPGYENASAESIRISIKNKPEISTLTFVKNMNFYDGIIDSQVNYNLMDFLYFY